MLFTLAPQLWELKGHLPFLWSSVWMVAAEVANIKLDKAILEIWLARMYHCKLNFLSLELQSLSLGLRLATGNSGLGRRSGQNQRKQWSCSCGKGGGSGSIKALRLHDSCFWSEATLGQPLKADFFLMRVLYKKGSHWTSEPLRWSHLPLSKGLRCPYTPLKYSHSRI